MNIQALYSLIICVSLFIALYGLKDLLILNISRKTRKKTRWIYEYSDEKKVLLMEEFLKPFADFINNKIKITKYDREILERNLLRLGEEITPEQHEAKKIIYPSFMVLLGLGLSFFSVTILAVSTIFAIFMYFQPDSELEKKVKELNGNILKEFPRFARTLRYSPHENIIHTIEDYLKISKGPLYYDLKILHAKIEAGTSEKEALQDFADKIGIHAIQNYIMAVITGLETSKENVDTLYAIQEEKIRQMNLSNIKDEMNKRPEILERINAVVLYSIMAMNGLAIILSFFYDFTKQF
ncbi:hypothetical protein [Maledivibacter halophilus]|uniref:Flp pilus assembly protein TadB n=1 Tax=Maledivibacter halophilus TaxID=36842 RepID=A0A1T5LTA5_9FIRM|nr:hypothetical protein [Maledivibacter halophilus]SKC78758.1 hypothetical protein SAMN02194393_03207 [Maledivibacter halophilus]